MDAKLTTLNLCLVLLACVALVDGQTASTTTSVDADNNGLNFTAMKGCPHYVSLLVYCECWEQNSTCGKCIQKSIHCAWCESLHECRYYRASDVISSTNWCPMGDIKTGTCTMSLKILIIVCSTLAGIVLISVCLCVYCCCCRSKKGISRRDLQEEQAQNAEAETRRTKNAERRAERQARWDEIRQKYGLSSASNTAASYSRFSNEASEA